MRRLVLNSRGLSLLEIILAVITFVIVIAGLYQLIGRNMLFFKRSEVRQRVVLESRICIDRITQMLSNGKASSLSRSTPATNPIIPDSRIDFVLQTPLASGTTAYAIYIENGIVYALEYVRTGIQRKQVLATNVTNLNFSGNADDPAIVGVNLRIDAPYDSSNDPTHVSTIIVANHIVHMVDTP